MALSSNEKLKRHIHEKLQSTQPLPVADTSEGDLGLRFGSDEDIRFSIDASDKAGVSDNGELIENELTAIRSCLGEYLEKNA